MLPYIFAPGYVLYTPILFQHQIPECFPVLLLCLLGAQVILLQFLFECYLSVIIAALPSYFSFYSLSVLTNSIFVVVIGTFVNEFLDEFIKCFL